MRKPKQKASEAQTPKRQVRISDARYGLSMVDPSTGDVYTHKPAPVNRPSTWVDAYLRMGILVEA